MGTCKSCRHSNPVTESDASEALTAATMGTDRLTILDNPTFSSLRGVGEWRYCKARMSLVAASGGCEHHAHRLMSVFASPAKDARLYEQVQAEMAAQREAEIRLAREQTLEAERNMKNKPCESCGFLHDRCLDCEMPWAFCDKCAKCGGGVRYYRSLGGWECSLCEAPADKPLARCEWPAGRCDSCREIHQAREARDGAAADRPAGS